MSSHAFELCDGLRIGAGEAPLIIAGPCVIESVEQVLGVARAVAEVAARRGCKVVFKASFDKANRSSIESFRGPGLDAGLEALALVRAETGMPILTDVHLPEQAAPVAAVADILQVPAFLCRQTDLLLACGRTGKPVNVKKGQFLAPEDMGNVVAKLHASGNHRTTITERGTSFGYHNLVVDMRALPMMRRFAPVIFDCTHSLQLPGGLGHATGGAREFHSHLARAAAAVGVDGFFIEVHGDPARALSDATTQLSVDEFDALLQQILVLAAAAAEFVS